jgi:hypothetical protein
MEISISIEWGGHEEEGRVHVLRNTPAVLTKRNRGGSECGLLSAKSTRFRIPSTQGSKDESDKLKSTCHAVHRKLRG